MFDYNRLISQYGISPDVAEQIIAEIKEEFADDEMMMELHVVRALRSYAHRFEKIITKVTEKAVRIQSQ